MIRDDRPLPLRAEDRADEADAQEWNVRLADCLRAADVALDAMLDSLAHSDDILAGRRRAKHYGTEARNAIGEAIEAREQLAIAQRRAGLMAVAYEARG